MPEVPTQVKIHGPAPIMADTHYPNGLLSE